VDVVAGDGDNQTGIMYGIGLGYDIAVSPKLEVGIDLSADLLAARGVRRGVVLPNDQACIPIPPRSRRRDPHGLQGRSARHRIYASPDTPTPPSSALHTPRCHDTAQASNFDRLPPGDG
jgi:hypothetical protein